MLFRSYDFVVNRTVPAAGKSLLERYDQSGEWKPVTEVKFAVQGAELHLAVPRQALGLEASPLRLDFKWADHTPDSGNILDFLDHGDVAPGGRFNYRFEEAK